jgi:hypothetical protein
MRHTYKILLMGMFVALTAWLDVAALRAISLSGARDRGTTMLDLRIDAGHMELLRVSMLLMGMPHR